MVTKVEGGKYEGKFLRTADTKNDSGFVYKNPPKDDICAFSKIQIVKKVDAPEPYGRYGLLKFNIHNSNL